MAFHSALRSFSITLLCLFTGLPTGVWAETGSTPRYVVEILVFEHLRADSGEELWRMTDVQAGADDFEAIAGTAVDMQGGRGIVPLQDPGSLQAIADAMRRSSLYRPLLQWRWLQPGWERGAAVPIALAADGSSARLQGTVSLALSRYLHLTADLGLVDASGARMQMKETRRMRSGELHYLDHPRFGLLVRITPHAARADD